MSTTYRISRNLEASIIEYIERKLADNDWTGINVEKTFTRVYDQDPPTICVRVGATEHNSVEIGSDSTWRNPLILIDIFGSDDGNRLDLKDFLVEYLKGGCTYYEYTISNGATVNKNPSGKIQVTKISDTPINLDIEKDKLTIHDRFRHLISLSVRLGKVET